MEKFIIHGGKPLQGEIEVKGSKNAALKLLAGSILSDEEWRIENVPEIEDVHLMIELLKDLGVEVQDDYRLRAKNLEKRKLDSRLANKLRASIVLVGPLLARVGKVEFVHPGGCAIGQRPIDIFLRGFKALGADIKETHSGYQIAAKKLRGCKFVFPKISVTATEALMMSAVLAKGKTKLLNCACEPEIPALANFLNKCGAKIRGAGTHTIKIEGARKLLGRGVCKVIPDRIETGTFAILAAATNSRIKITHCNPEHLEVLWAILNRMGVDLDPGRNSILVKPRNILKASDLTTHTYPGFATDLQAPFTVLVTQSRGSSLIHETIFEGRLFYTELLNKMGANVIMCDPHRVIVSGPTPLYGAHITSPDIRSGIALVIAGLVAKGRTVIENIYQIDRGYERIEERLGKLGADIKRVAV